MKHWFVSPFRPGKLFLISFGVTTAVLCLLFFLSRPKEQRSGLPHLVPIADDVYLTSQLGTANIPALKRRAIRTIVDIRPDGEAQDETPSSEIETAARQNNILFHYIPVPHETIPDKAVTAMENVLTEEPRPMLLYCRTGRRAVRLYALVQASRPDGPSTNAILKMVSDAGFSADDLKDEINQRLSRRNRAAIANP